MKIITGIIAGNFDIIHPGYIHMFTQMKAYCDRVVVLLHEDPSIERPEKMKPVLNIENRKLILKSLRQVDKVYVYRTEEDLYNLIKAVKPDYRFLGEDYKDKRYTGDDLGIDIQWVNRGHGWSTTKFKQLIAESL